MAVALGNWGSPEAVPVLAQPLEDEEPLIRGHAARALARSEREPHPSVVDEAEVEEADAGVREELALALEGLVETA